MNKKYLKINLSAVFWAMVVIVMVFPGQAVQADLQKPPESNRMKPDHAPTPFSAEEIRIGCPRDRKIVFQVETFGKQMVFQTLTFVTVSEKEVVFESMTTGMEGKRVGSRRMSTGTWKDLQSHASFPGAQTKIQKEPFTINTGTFDCWRYEVTLKKEGKTNVQRYWFALDLPGPPICFEETVDGKLAFKMTMLKTGM